MPCWGVPQWRSPISHNKIAICRRRQKQIATPVVERLDGAVAVVAAARRGFEYCFRSQQYGLLRVMAQEMVAQRLPSSSESRLPFYQPQIPPWGFPS